jgi:NAD(P)-dependent dehydrogenase (short-subunit alcohol dehydrogenase family)
MQSMNISGRTALVVGASGKIGFAIAEALIEEGVNICCHFNHNQANIEQLVSVGKRKGIAISQVQADLNYSKDQKAVFTLINKSLELTGELNILVNCLGDFLQKPLPALIADEFRNIIESNLSLAFDLTQEALPHIKKSGAGRILHIGYATASQIEAKPSILPYHIAKMGLILLTKSFAIDEAKQKNQEKVLINCLSPGICENSHFLPQNEIPLGRPANLTEISEAAIFLLKSDYITGTNLEIDGGWRGSNLSGN